MGNGSCSNLNCLRGKPVQKRTDVGIEWTKEEKSRDLRKQEWGDLI